MSLSNDDSQLQQPKVRPVKKRSDEWIIAIGKSRGFTLVDSQGKSKEIELRESADAIAGFLEKLKLNLDGHQAAELYTKAAAKGKDAGLITNKDWKEAITDYQKWAVLNLAVTTVERDLALRAYNQIIEEADEGVSFEEDICRDRVARLARALLDHANALANDYLRREPGDQHAIDKERETAVLLSHDLLGDNEDQREAFEQLAPGPDKIEKAREIINANLQR